MATGDAQQPDATPRIFSIGAIRFLNTRPLIHGLSDHPRVRLAMAVPSVLGRELDAGRLDVAIAPVIDYQRADGRWALLRGGCIASDGETLTVRIFSRAPIDRITRLAVDADSHTSVVLARLLLRQRFGIEPAIEPANMNSLLYQPAEMQPESVLLIGDKVVAAGPNDPRSPWPHQIDLGSAWREWTGLPFVFAAWATQAGADLGDLPRMLETARQAGLAQRPRIAHEQGPALGWPAELALTYLTRHMQYELTERYRAGLERFYELAAEHGLIDRLVPVKWHRNPS